MDPHKTMSEKSDASTGRSYCVNFKLTHMENINQPMQFSQSDSGDVVAQVPIVGSSGSLNVGDEPHLVDHAVESTGKNANDKRQRQRTSKIWNDFVYVEVGGMKKLQCKWCKRLFAVSSSSSTSTLGRHLVACVKYMESNKKQRTISFDPGVGSEVGTLSKFSFNESKVRELAAHMVLFHEYPFNIMEHELFNMFMRACTPHWKKISGATVRNECFNIYNSEKKKLKTLLSGVEKVNITTDMWTSSQKVSYMVVTCHFVDFDWFLQKRILNFCNVSPPHSGVVISDALRKSFVEWGIEDKIFTITADNASVNDVAIRILKDEFELRGVLPIKGQLFHVRCCAHVTNLLVQAGIAEISHIIDLVREGIKYLVASEGRFREFSAIAKQLHLPFKKLILDVPTRWNSTYMMLATAIQFKDVFPRYYQHDQFFKWVVTPEQWEKVENVNKFLDIFNEVTNIVSGSEYPTSNLFLPEVWRMKEILSKSMDMNEYIKAMAIKMSTKFDKCWNECNLLMAIAAVLDPRYKMKLINFCFPLIYPEPDATLHIDKVLSCLGELYEVYVLAHNSSIQQQCAQENATSLSASTRDVVPKVSTGRLRYLEHIRSNNSIRPLKTDLDVYLEEDIYICENDENGEDIDTEFEALTWWKFNALKYRILSKMARDILAVPISTVASEAAFSAGSRVIEPHKASLSVETVQMLLCGSDWVRAIHGIPKKSDVVKMIEVDLPTVP